MYIIRWRGGKLTGWIFSSEGIQEIVTNIGCSLFISRSAQSGVWRLLALSCRPWPGNAAPRTDGRFGLLCQRRLKTDPLVECAPVHGQVQAAVLDRSRALRSSQSVTTRSDCRACPVPDTGLMPLTTSSGISTQHRANVSATRPLSRHSPPTSVSRLKSESSLSRFHTNIEHEKGERDRVLHGFRRPYCRSAWAFFMAATRSRKRCAV